MSPICYYDDINGYLNCKLSVNMHMKDFGVVLTTPVAQVRG